MHQNPKDSKSFLRQIIDKIKQLNEKTEKHLLQKKGSKKKQNTDNQ